MKTLKILLADDHQMLLESLADSINQNEAFEVVATAFNGQEILHKLEIYDVDILVCDIQMPVLDGIGAILQVRQLYPNIKILMLSMLEDAPKITMAINAGANGYILKKAKKAELEKAILTIAKGEKYFSKEILQILEVEEPTQDNLPTGLTQREIEILKLIAKEFSSTQIASELSISLNTVESHRKNIYQKLNIKNLAGAIRFSLQNKLIE
jgi:DNA-binding NarL/FixJ family response regulator